MADAPAHPTEPATADDRTVNWAGVLNGGLLGMVLLAAASIVIAVLDHNRDDFDGSALQRVMLVVIFLAYVGAGVVGARSARSNPITNGALAAIAALVIWIPLRIVVWMVRDNGRELVGGDDPVFTVGALFGHLVIASAFGMIGAFAYMRWQHRRDRSRSAPPPPSGDGLAA